MTNAYMIFLDELRKKRNIKITSFCEDVCSDRAYRRYIIGERVPSQSVLQSFCDKLGITLADLYTLSDLDERIYSKLNIAYTKLNEKRTTEAANIISEINSSTIRSDTLKKFYQYLQIKVQYNLNSISEAHAYSLYLDLVKYPNITETVTLNFVEIVTLLTLADLEYSRHGKVTDISAYLYKILTNESYTVSRYFNYDLLPYMYLNLSILYGKSKDYISSNILSELGIKYCLNRNNNSNLTELYYVSTLAKLELGAKSYILQ